MLDSSMLLTRKNDTPVIVWGVWIPRRGDNLIFTMEVVGNHGTYITAELFHKNYEDTGEGTSAGESMVFDEDLGRQSVTKVGTKELIRVRLTLERGMSVGDGDVGWVLYRFLQPVWFENVKV